MSLNLQCDFALDDIVEFKDMCLRDGIWVFEEDTYIERIRSIIFNVATRSQDYPIELWGQLYNECPGRMYFTPERVVRVVDKSSNPNACFTGQPPIAIGTKVTFETDVDNKTMRVLDEVIGFEVAIRAEGTDFQYYLKDSGYCMESDEIEVVK